MTNYSQLREIIQSQLKQQAQQLRISAATLEKALEQAASQLSLPLDKIGYKLLQDSSNPSLATSHEVVIIAYPQPVSSKETPTASPEESLQEQNNTCSLRVTAKEVLLRVNKPQQNQRAISLSEVQDAIVARLHYSVNNPEIATIIEQADGKYHTIAPFQHDPLDDPPLSLEINSSQMTAWLHLGLPKKRGIDHSAAAIAYYLKTKGITHGIINEVLRNIEEYPRYGHPYKVAVASAAAHGKDAIIEYQLKEHSPSPKAEESHGQLHPRYLRPIINVLKGQVIAIKHPATRGVDGITVYGSTLPATDGKDLPLRCGKGAILIENENKVIAEYPGQVSLHDSLIEVRKSHVINGDVDLKCGNIIFLGNILIRGNVNDGFIVKASGRIEVLGHVEKAYLDSEDDIIIHRGISGRGEAYINSDGNISSQFIENAKVRAAKKVMVSNSIVNSDIWAGEKIICSQRRASIIGGSISATEFISAKSIGTAGGNLVRLEVGQNPFRLQYLTEIQQYRDNLKGQLRHYLLMERKTPTEESSSVSSSRTEQEEKIAQEKQVVYREIEKIEAEIKELEDEIVSLQVAGRVCVARSIYPGVKLTINGIAHTIQQEIVSRCFTASGGRIRITPYGKDVSTAD